MVERAFDEAWIDFYPREGKVGGAFCANLDGHNQSRVLTNFDGSFSDIVTRAPSAEQRLFNARCGNGIHVQRERYHERRH